MRLVFAAALCALASGATMADAQTAPAAPDDPTINQLVVYGQDPCPESTDEVITVCARKDERERYRIPENLRDDPNDPLRQSWAARASELQYVGRSGIGSCSTIGPGGATGCYTDLVRQAKAERATRDSVNWARLIEEARRERLGRIDEEAAAAEADAGPR